MYTLHINDLLTQDVHVQKFETKQEAINEGEKWKKLYKDISYWVEEPIKEVNHEYGTSNKSK